jgi:hypothetical protein
MIAMFALIVLYASILGALNLISDYVARDRQRYCVWRRVRLVFLLQTKRRRIFSRIVEMTICESIQSRSWRANRSSRFTVSTMFSSVVLGLIVQRRSEVTPFSVVEVRKAKPSPNIASTSCV